MVVSASCNLARPYSQTGCPLVDFNLLKKNSTIFDSLVMFRFFKVDKDFGLIFAKVFLIVLILIESFSSLCYLS